MALLVKRFGKFMKKKGYRARRKNNATKKRNDENMRCFRCHSKDHLIAKCPYDSDDENAINKERKKQKKKMEAKESKSVFSKKKKNEAHLGTWDSDDSSSDEEEERKSKKKGHASIAIQEKKSLFDTSPSCFMAKATKVQDSDSDSDEEDDLTKEELITMLEELKTCYFATKKECKSLRKDKQSLAQELDELKASHECLKEDHESLQLAHTKLEKAHSIITEQVVVTSDIGVTCDILEEPFIAPIVVAPTNPPCSTSTSTSSTSDPSLLVENKSLKEEVKKLNHTLAKAYGGEDRLLMCLGSQRASLHKEGLGYIPKKGKAAFAPHKTSFVRNNGRYCKACKQVGHLEQNCMNKKNAHTNVSSIKFDSFYVLAKSAKGVEAKFIGAPWMKKAKTLWVPKSLVTNLQGPKQCWVPKKN
jgi:hypothetical protein